MKLKIDLRKGWRDSSLRQLEVFRVERIMVTWGFKIWVPWQKCGEAADNPCWRFLFPYTMLPYCISLYGLPSGKLT